MTSIIASSTEIIGTTPSCRLAMAVSMMLIWRCGSPSAFWMSRLTLNFSAASLAPNITGSKKTLPGQQWTMRVTSTSSLSSLA